MESSEFSVPGFDGLLSPGGLYFVRGEAMTLYVDEVLLENVLVDYCLMRTALCVTGQPASRWRLWLGAGLGGLYAAMTLAPGLGFLACFPAQAAVFLLMCAAAFGLERAAMPVSVWYLVLQLGFGGLVFAVVQLLKLPAFLWGGRLYYPVGPRLLALLLGLFFLTARLTLRRYFRHRGGSLVPLELDLQGRKVACTALVDTGNTLLDPVSGREVPVLSWRLAKRLLPRLPEAEREDAAALFAFLRHEQPGLRLRLLPYRAVGREGGLLLGLWCDEVHAGRLRGPGLVALSPQELAPEGPYQALLPGEFSRDLM